MPEAWSAKRERQYQHIKDSQLDKGVPEDEAEEIAAEIVRLRRVDPSLAEAIHDEPAVWLVDPVDGTSNFVAGRPDYAVMCSLVRTGRTVASWIWQPATATGYRAELGSGAWRDSERLTRPPAPADAGKLTGVLKSRFLDPVDRHRLEAGCSAFGEISPGRSAAGIEYPDVVEGRTDFIFYWRTLPWDHAPGSLLLAEAGGVAARLDGTPYQPEAPGCVDGLLVAADPDTWERTRGILLDA